MKVIDAGNEQEWVQDSYRDDYTDAPTDGSGIPVAHLVCFAGASMVLIGTKTATGLQWTAQADKNLLPPKP